MMVVIVVGGYAGGWGRGGGDKTVIYIVGETWLWVFGYAGKTISVGWDLRIGSVDD